MTLEERELVIKDLCGRLPYGVKVKFGEGGANVTLQSFMLNNFMMFDNVEIKSYLRPMKSMTEEERVQFESSSCVVWNDDIDTHTYEERKIYSQCLAFDWLNAHHFDYRGLIGKGLALEAPEDMYKTK